MAKWCNHYQCWNSDVEEVTGNIRDCDSCCDYCTYSEEIEPSR